MSARSAIDLDGLTPDLLLRHDKPGPRYTSYPTAPVWREDLPVQDFEAALRRVRTPASVYVHIPFCVEQCTFCACNMVVAGRREPGTRYLDDLERYVGSMPLAADRIDVTRIHLGGGTPTWLSVAELERLYEILLRRFRPIDGAELSVEADPEVTSDAQLEALAAIGVNRLSMGVQSFDPRVLAAVNRPQQHTRVHGILDRCRALGMKGTNLDLMYGLPFQDEASFRDTLDKTLAMRPDRLAVFSYAHVPWLKAHQRFIDEGALPDPSAKMGLFLQALRVLTDAGYQFIGMDHFALPDDELATAQRDERLHRNFMGYTTRPDVELIGIGMSAISELDDLYVQVRSKLAHWWRAIEKGAPLIEKGWRLSAEDKLRRDAISRLMCNLVLPFAPIEDKHGIRFADHFASEIQALTPLEAEGLVTVDPHAIRVTPLGRLLVRNVAMVFDPYLKSTTSTPRFSRTV